jgi:RNA polymerase sigma-70 factor (ECF subfamily)
MTPVPPGDTTELSTPEAAEELPVVERARAGDSSAFSELVKRYERKIFRLAKNITQNDEDAEDVLQETFLKAYSHLGSFQGQSKFYTWLVRIAVNEALMKLRKRKSDKTVPLDEPQETGEDTVISPSGRTTRRRDTAGRSLRVYSRPQWMR